MNNNGEIYYTKGTEGFLGYFTSFYEHVKFGGDGKILNLCLHSLYNNEAMLHSICVHAYEKDTAP